MEVATADGSIDSLEALRRQLETSLMSAFDFDDTSNTAIQLEVTAGADDKDPVVDDDGNNKWSFEILDLIASPAPRSRQSGVVLSSTMPATTNCEAPSDKPAPVSVVDFINNNDASEQSVLIDECSYCYDGDYYEGDIRQLEASPIVFRPKNTDSNVIQSETISTRRPTVTTKTVDGVPVDAAVQITEVFGVTTSPLEESCSLDSGDDHSDDVIDGGVGLRLLNLKESPAVMRIKRNQHAKPYADDSISKSSSATSYTKASNKDDECNTRVQELARRIDNQSSSSIDITSKRSKQDVLPVDERRGSVFRSIRRKDEQRATYTESEDFRLTDDERRWIICSASSNYQAMSRLLVNNPALACRRDPITGQTALHWAAKNGRPDVVKLVLGSVASPPVECRTREAGHTPLHLAAMHGRHDVIELLVVVYRANRDATDFAGRLPIKYLEQWKLTQAAKGIDSATMLWLRSEALLKPSDKFVVPRDIMEYKEPSTRQVTVSRRSSIWSSITGSSLPPSTAGGAADRRPSTLMRGMSSFVEQTGASTLLLPPRQLPAVNQRQSVMSVKQVPRDESTAAAKVSSESVSVSDDDDEDGSRLTPTQRAFRSDQSFLRNTSSTPDFGTLI